MINSAQEYLNSAWMRKATGGIWNSGDSELFPIPDSRITSYNVCYTKLLREIELFLKQYFYSRLSIEDLCNDIDFVKLDREDDSVQLLETYMISQEGLSFLEKSDEEVKREIQERFGDVLGKPIEEVRDILYMNDESMRNNFV